MKKKILKNIDWGIFICCILLVIIGMIALFSATYDSEDTSLQRQLIWFVICIPVVFIIIFIDYEAIAKISPILYGIVLILLVIVLFTDPVNGATSWFNLGFLSIQPAEFAKIAVILFLALVLCKIQERGKNEINRPTKLLIALAVVAIPVLLIIKQPDYGTAAAFLVATVMILFTAGINKKYIIGTIFKSRVRPTWFRIQFNTIKTCNRSRSINRNGITKRKSNTARFLISKNNRLYIFCYWRRDGLYSCR